MDKVQLQRLTNWTGFVGVISIIFGIISAISGLFLYIIGAIPGIITIILGVKLLNVKNTGKALLFAPEGQDNTAKINELFSNLGVYFKIQGILIIISLVLMIIAIITTISVGMALFEGFANITSDLHYY